jgi:hypothetical protein
VKGRKSFLLRLEPELYRAVEEWAQQEMRSVNGQVEWILKEACERRYKRTLPGGAGEPTPAERPGVTAERGGASGGSMAPDRNDGANASELDDERERRRSSRPLPLSNAPLPFSGLEPLVLPPEMTGANPLPEFDGFSYGDPTLPFTLPDLTRDLEPPPGAR